MNTYKTLDLERIKTESDLLALAEHDTTLKRVKARRLEFSGPCPMPGCSCDDDGFRVQPEMHRWLCRTCTDGKWRSVIDYIALRDRLDPHNQEQLTEICRRAIGGEVPTTNGARAARPARIITPATKPPAGDWQTAGAALVRACEETLWSPAGARALAYLREKRGLQDETIKRFRLGYNPKDAYLPAEAWGCPGDSDKAVYVPEGIVIPCFVRGRLWYLKIRQRIGKEPKYLQVRGSRPAIFNADEMLDAGVALLCEGEIDTITAWQELGDVLAPVTLGGSTNTPDLVTFGPYLRSVHNYLAAYDNDAAGAAGADRLHELITRLKQCPLPQGVKDINELHTSGQSLGEWITPFLEQVQPFTLPEVGRALGAVVTDWTEIDSTVYFDCAEAENRAGNLTGFALAFARGMILEGEDPQTWDDWAANEYQVPAGEILRFAELVKG